MLSRRPRPGRGARLPQRRGPRTRRRHGPASLPRRGGRVRGGRRVGDPRDPLLPADDDTYTSFDQARLFRNPPLRAARRDDWKTEPDPPLRPLAFERSLDPGQAAALALGTVPEEMENKWFVFQEDDKIHFHRSWTGILVFRVTETANRLHDVEFNEAQFNGTDEEASASLGQLVDWLASRAG